jgi:hypothetical protein
MSRLVVQKAGSNASARRGRRVALTEKIDGSSDDDLAADSQKWRKEF